MHRLLHQDAPDEAVVMQQADRIGEIRTEGQRAMLHTLLAIRGELTQEQRAQLEKLMHGDGPPHWRRGRDLGAPADG